MILHSRMAEFYCILLTQKNKFYVDPKKEKIYIWGEKVNCQSQECECNFSWGSDVSRDGNEITILSLPSDPFFIS